MTESLTTTYPGLLAGSGLSHAAGGQDEEFKLGFSFDHTTGLPYVPASSVKGALRSLLSMLLNVPSEDRQQFLAFVLEKEKVDWNKKQLEDFISDSFGSQSQKGKDIFLDAFPVAQEDSKGEKTHQPFVGSDSITPHKGALKNPTPLTFLKILPNVSIKFAFFLKPYSIKGIEVISITEKERLFENLLSNYGIGAKTNVGYGQFK